MDVTIWRVRLDAGPDSDALLAPDERERSHAFRDPRDAVRYLRGRVALRAILAQELGRDASELRFAYGANGKPRLADCEIGFNVSRSGMLGVIAVCRSGEVGVDCERIGDEGLAFYRRWTHLEASTKLHGRALAHTLAAGSPDPADAVVDIDLDPRYAAALATHVRTTWRILDHQWDL